MNMKINKTNVMRILDQEKTEYTPNVTNLRRH